MESGQPDFDCPGPAGAVGNWCNVTKGQIGAYPNDLVVVQNDFSITGDGAVSAYIFDDISTGVLSIPSFYQATLGVKYFFNAIDEFIGNATTRGTKRVVINLQQNGGGQVLLAFTTFQQFFPATPPYTASRMRSHEFAEILGTACTKWWQSLDIDSAEALSTADSEWVAVNRINAATGQNFASWPEYFGPIRDGGDGVSQKQMYNLTDEVFDYEMFGWVYEPWVNLSAGNSQASWAPDKIVLMGCVRLLAHSLSNL
ncbi:hypothetical protein NX059_009188 [Plenodomus lindquistii]|nr:hypothetical protein NX059_009188 [Plenodomus lindquistii]